MKNYEAARSVKAQAIIPLNPRMKKNRLPGKSGLEETLQQTN
ncbi:hypothetical protein [Paenibacillus sp. PastF-2]|nr:hypothetical protein [Paenibacillus sp. PastF-2]